MLPPEVIKELRKDFPKEAVQVKMMLKDPSTGKNKKVFTGYKPQYIIERLNDAFGHENWDFDIVDLGVQDKSAWCRGKLTIYVSKQDPDAIGGPLTRSVMTAKTHIGSCEYKGDMSYGDAMKGAVTNCIEKCASMLDIGHTAYKGLLEATKEAMDEATENVGGTKAVEANERESMITELKVLCKDAKIGAEAFKAMIKNVLKQDKEPKDLLNEDIEKLIAHVKKTGSPF